MGAAVSDADRVTNALRAIVREFTAPTQFFGVYRYRVASQQGPLLDLVPVSPALGLPDLVGVKARPGVAGAREEFGSGPVVAVGFLDGDPALPFVGWREEEGQPGFLPLETAFDAVDKIEVGPTVPRVELGGGTASVGRVGDSVAVGTIAFFPGTGGASLTYNGSPVTGPVTITGTITSGATKVKA